MIRTVRIPTRVSRIGDVEPFGATCQPACSAGGTLCPDPTGTLASINPCCGMPYTATPDDGYCGGGSTPLVNAITSQVGGAQDPCTAGGLLCPQPNSPGASLNPCCLVSPSTADNLDTPTGVPFWAWLAGAGILILALVKK